MVQKEGLGMKLIALMVVRNEDWVIEASLKAAFRWCDGVALYLDRCTDKTYDIVMDTVIGKNFKVRGESGGQHWDEMAMRQQNLEDGRAMGGTHFAIVDADEILTANLMPVIKTWFLHLSPGQLMDLPMVPIRGDLDHYQDDDSVWSRAYLTVGFRDMPGLSHRPGPDGYQHHNRPPFGCLPNRMRPLEGLAAHGGVMHLQFANQRRLLAKHVLYRMVDHLRWPGRETPKQLNYKYDQALQAPGKLSAAPAAWWDGYAKETIKLDGVPYQEDEIRRLLAEHGREAFEGLDLKGW